MCDKKETLVKVFARIFEIPETVVYSATFQNTEKWDSLTHMNLIMEIEQEILKRPIDMDMSVKLVSFEACLRLINSENIDG